MPQIGAVVARTGALVIVGTLLGCGGSPRAPVATTAAPAGTFELASLRLHLHEESGAVELIVEAAAPTGMRRLVVRDPQGVVRLDETLGRIGRGGVDEVRLQAPEESIDRFPEGPWRLEAETVGGRQLLAVLPLRLDLLPAPELTPIAREPTPPDAVDLSWTQVGGAAAYVIEIEHEEAKVLTATLPATQGALRIPAGLLAEETVYEVNVQVVSPSGHRTETDGAFVTGSR